MALLKKRIHHPEGFLLEGFLISKQLCISLCVVIPFLLVEDEHCCNKDWCQFYQYTNKHESETPLIRIVEYSRKFHNSDAIIVLVQPIVWVMRVLYSSGSVSHHPGSSLNIPLSFQKYQYRLLQRIVLLKRTEFLLGQYAPFVLFT